MKELLLPEVTGDFVFASVGALWLLPMCYLLTVNLAAFHLFGRDKRLSKKQHARRIPEKTLFLFALAGGSIGAILGMKTFRHKTRHRYFVIGLPLILLVQIALVALFFM